ncbi:MAG: hypothetical protein AB7N71_10620 [Phycisphaerae bacterium]
MTKRSLSNADRILTRHPEGKEGVNIERAKYDAMKSAILRSVGRSRTGILFQELPQLVRDQLPEAIFPRNGSVMWYVTTVKLDLEARGLIERVPGKSPQRLRRSKAL